MNYVGFVLLNLSLTTGASPYAEARQQSLDTGRPFVVLVGADWCPHCVTMKKSVIPQVRRTGILDDVHFVQVDTDGQPDLANKLMKGSGIPQLVMFRKKADGDAWLRTRITGGQSVKGVTAFIKRGLGLN